MAAAADGRMALARRAAVVGVGTTRHGEHPGVGQYELATRVLKDALEDAAIDRSAVDGLLVGGKAYEEGVEAPQLAYLLGMNPRVTGALDYGAGAAIVHYAAMLVATGTCRTVACVYARNPPGAMTEIAGNVTWDATYGATGVLAAATLGWTRHMALYGSSADSLGPVVVGARRHARLNPEAAFREPLDLEGYLAHDFTVWPFRSLDFCRMTAGAVALVFTAAERAGDHPRPPVLVEAVGRHQAARELENGEHLLCPGMREVARQVYESSGIGPADVDVLGITDAFSGSVMHTLENYGFCEEGASPEFVEGGTIELGGALPVNTDGGHLSCGWLSGWTHQAELVRQLRGECGDRQVPGAKIAQYCTEGRFRVDYLSTVYSRG